MVLIKESGKTLSGYFFRANYSLGIIWMLCVDWAPRRPDRRPKRAQSARGLKRTFFLSENRYTLAINYSSLRAFFRELLSGI